MALEDALSDVRRTLDRILGADVASTVVFQALSVLPDPEELALDAQGIARFVAGPLTTILTGRLGEAGAASVVASVTTALEAGVEPAGPHGASRSSWPAMQVDGDGEVEVVVSQSDWPDVRVEDAAPAGVSHSQPTFRPPPMAPPGAEDAAPAESLRILVVGRGKRLSFRILAAFGGHRVRVEKCHTLDGLRMRLAELDPAMVVVDGRDAADIAPVDLAPELAADDRLFIVVWGSDQFWGSAVSAALTRRRARHAPVPTATGVEPLFDFVRARLPPS